MTLRSPLISTQVPWHSLSPPLLPPSHTINQTHTAMIKNNKKEGGGIGPVGICFSNVALEAEIDVFDRHREMN